ncbi:hypothetical protein EIP91_011098 [Steccherinum ochraceum]|uniref:Peptidase S54 rhomboid domain-containing protein n=1 Tax=Steccherinum ochraceum TaxID=92696 RepID=A0A4V2MXS9_9APHY|nr:hypothetical protein EIP91_011098 [Steccherinum ochraceum]
MSYSAMNATHLTTSNSPSFVQMISSKVLRATHRDVRFGSSSSSWSNFRRNFDHNMGQYVIWAILGINGMVFVSWYVARANLSQRDPSLYAAMSRNFISSAQNIQAGRIWTFATSIFSHEQPAHMLFNCLAIYTIAPWVLASMGSTTFIGFYLGSGIAANVFSHYWHKFARPNPNYQSHGASGSMSAVTAYFACIAPTAQLLLFGIIPMPAWTLVAGLLAYDGYNTYVDKQNGINAAAHVGGLMAGFAFFARRRFGL